MTTLFSNQKSKNFGSVFGYLNLRENLISNNLLLATSR